MAAAVWPGYEFIPEFLLCGRSGEALLVLTGPPPQSLGPADSIWLPGAAPHSAYLYANRPPDLPDNCFTLSYRVDDRRVVAFPVVDSMYSIKDPFLATVVSLYHEGFHRYQVAQFGPTRSNVREWRYEPLEAGLQLPAEVVQSAAFQRLAAEERAILMHALGVDAADSVRSLLRAYLAVRTARMQMLPEPLRGSEPHDERREGSAQLVGYMGGLLAVSGNTARATELVRSDLLNTPAFDTPEAGPDPRRHWHIYATGSAIGLLLDRLGASWQQELEGGETFVDLIARAVTAGRPRQNSY